MLLKPTILKSLAAIVFVLTLSFAANAQATRTWVSGAGDDANPCSRTVPCKTFAGAISKTTTAGEIDCLDPAGFGAVTITKSITIDCTETFGSILAAGTNGVIVNASVGTVCLRGLQINGAGTGINGIKIMTAGKVYVEDTVIDGFTQNGISIENSGDTKVVANNVTLRNNAGAGVNSASTGTSDVTVANSLLSGNGTGILAGTGATFRISGNSIVYNTIGLSAQGKIISFKNNAIDGNGTNGTPTSTVSLQ